MKKQQLKSEMREYRNRITIEEEGEKKTWRRSGPHSHGQREKREKREGKEEEEERMGWDFATNDSLS